MGSPDHHVQFYDHDLELVGTLTRYALAGLLSQTPVLVVATPTHRACLATALTQQGVDSNAAHGAFVVVDAAEALRGFMVDSHPDPALFTTQIGALLDSLYQPGRPTRVYGEMVALLCAAGTVGAAIELEALWNQLARSREFSLVCGYPTSMLDTEDLEDVARVCHSHTHLAPPIGYRSPQRTATAAGEPVQATKVFVPADEAVGAARSFVGDVLRNWGQALPTIDNAMLLTSEMATNALVHAESPFRITVTRSADAIGLAVQDTTPTTPQRRKVDTWAARGRGMGIIAALSSRHGCEVLPTGKVIWAELSSVA